MSTGSRGEAWCSIEQEEKRHRGTRGRSGSSQKGATYGEARVLRRGQRAHANGGLYAQPAGTGPAHRPKEPPHGRCFSSGRDRRRAGEGRRKLTGGRLSGQRRAGQQGGRRGREGGERGGAAGGQSAAWRLRSAELAAARGTHGKVSGAEEEERWRWRRPPVARRYRAARHGSARHGSSASASSPCFFVTGAAVASPCPVLSWALAGRPAGRRGGNSPSRGGEKAERRVWGSLDALNR